MVSSSLTVRFLLFPSQDVIVISGYERNVEEARRAIQQLVAELQEMVSHNVHLDPRTHARIIGARGKAIRKLMEEFKVQDRLHRQVPLLFVCVCACAFPRVYPRLGAFRWTSASLSRDLTSPTKSR